MVRVGITGGIGSGKTTVAKIFESLGVPVFYSDVEAKTILDSQSIIDQVVQVFGVEILHDFLVDRVKLGKLVFSDPTKLVALNNIIHPAVEQSFVTWIQKYKESNTPYALKESALFFELGIQTQVDRIILVRAPLEERIKRIQARDSHLTRENILERIRVQWTDEQKIPLADFVIENKQESMLIEQVMQIHKALLTN